MIPHKGVRYADQPDLMQKMNFYDDPPQPQKNASLWQLVDVLQTQRAMTQTEQYAYDLSRITDSILAARAGSGVYAPITMEELAELEKPVGGYSLNETKLFKNALAEVDRKVEILRAHPYIKIIIDGHTCDLGTPYQNYRVAMERAKNIKKYLVSKGIDASRILAVVSKAEEEPMVRNDNVINRRINRRIALRVVR
jgi:outer membrane protein OmpA-like peptidoglycan-associated protein